MHTQHTHSSWRFLPTQLALLLTFALVPFWLRLPGAPPPFSADYVTGFLFFWPLAAAILVWVLSGLPGLGRFLQSGPRLLWLLALTLLVAWSAVSQSWGFIAAEYPGVAQNAALQMGLVGAFALAAACTAPPRALIAVLIFSACWSGLLGALQVALQGPAGLQALGEFALDPARSGVSVVQAGDLRWLRPYGLTSHPNVLAGVFLAGMLACGAWLLAGARWQRLAGGAVLLALLWLLLLSFSRGAWVALAAAVVAVGPLLRHYWHRPGIRRRIGIVLLLAAVLGLAFVLMYRPLVAARAGAGTESLEMRSVADRVVFTTIAYVAIGERPLGGIGAGSFPWYSSYYIFYNTSYELTGNNVHHVLLLVTAELGLVGLALLLVLLASGIESALRAIHSDPEPAARIALLALVFALLAVGLVDHYPWTLPQFQALWLGSLAAALRP